MNNNGKRLKITVSALLILHCVLLLTGCGNRSTREPYTTTENRYAEAESTEQTTAGQQSEVQWNWEENGALSLIEQSEQKLTETDLRVMQSMVRIQAGDLLGSGVIYEDRDDTFLIVTAAHVLEHDTGEILVTFPDGTQVSATGREVAKNNDLAFLQVEKDKLPMGEDGKLAVLPAETDRETFDKLEVYEDVWMYGGGEELPVYAFVVDPWIYVEDFEQYMLLLQGNIVPGMSGGGVFTEDGIFVGILCGADDTGKVAVVPYSIVETEKP